MNEEINQYFKEYFKQYGVEEENNIFKLEFEKVYKTILFKVKKSHQILINDNPTLKATFSKTMKNHEDGLWILYPGSSIDGLLELGKVRNNNSAQEINVREGDIIKWLKI